MFNLCVNEKVVIFVYSPCIMVYTQNINIYFIFM